MTKKTPPQIIGTVFENLDKIYTGIVIRITQTTTPLAVYIPGAIWTGQKYQNLPLTPLKNLLYNRSYVKQLNAWSCRAGKTTKIVNFVILVVQVLTSEPVHTPYSIFCNAIDSSDPSIKCASTDYQINIHNYV